MPSPKRSWPGLQHPLAMLTVVATGVMHAPLISGRSLLRKEVSLEQHPENREFTPEDHR